MTQAPGRAYPQTGVAAFTTRQRSAVDGADGATPLDQLTGEQSSAALGDPIPLVFCNRVDGVGGVWIDPPATFARFENDAADTLTVSYHLVLSEGQLGGVSCVWQGTERRAGPGAEETPDRPLAVVDWEYGQRAGDWQPGVFIDQNWKLATQTNTQDVKGAAVASEAEIPEARASVKLTSKSDYVTRFEFTAKMIDWGSRIPALISGKNGTGEESGGFSIPSSYTNETKPLRNLGDWSFSRERSTEVQRIELDHVEDVYWDDKFIPEATYRCTILEESIEPGRIYDIPAYIGNDRGSYQGLSTLSFVDVYPVGNETWKQAVHVFIEDGAQVAPLLGGPEAEASSNLLPDLARYLMVRRGRPADLIDTDALTESARFNQANGLLFNGVLAVPTNLRDYLFRVAPFYLLRVSNRGGAVGLRPAVPTDETGAIVLGPVSPVLTLTEDHILPGSFDQEIIGLDERRPFIAVGLWREQPLDEIGIQRATEVRRTDTPDDAPVEQFDLTEFCVTEDHAAKAMIYQLARRSNITHRLSVAVRPEPEIAALATGDILRVQYRRMVAGPGGGVSVHDFFYELDQVETADEGAVVLRLTHYPVTDLQESVFAAEVVRGFETRDGFTWSDAPAEYGNNTIDPGAGATEDLDQAKDPPIPFGGVASFGEPEFITTGAPAIVVKVCMDKPAQTEDMLLRLTSELQAFNNQVIKIGIGQQCGQVEVPVDGTESGTVGILGYTGGGYVNPDLSDQVAILGSGALYPGYLKIEYGSTAATLTLRSGVSAWAPTTLYADIIDADYSNQSDSLAIPLSSIDTSAWEPINCPEFAAAWAEIQTNYQFMVTPSNVVATVAARVEGWYYWNVISTDGHYAYLQVVTDGEFSAFVPIRRIYLQVGRTDPEDVKNVQDFSFTSYQDASGDSLPAGTFAFVYGYKETQSCVAGSFTGYVRDLTYSDWSYTGGGFAYGSMTDTGEVPATGGWDAQSSVAGPTVAAWRVAESTSVLESESLTSISIGALDVDEALTGDFSSWPGVGSGGTMIQLQGAPGTGGGGGGGE